MLVAFAKYMKDKIIRVRVKMQDVIRVICKIWIMIRVGVNVGI